jgi:hypothetical protein
VKELNMKQRNLISIPAAWPFSISANAAILGFWASLLGCSGESVNMGENDVQPTPLPSSSRCLESTTLLGDVIVRNQEEVNSLEGCEVIEGDLHIVAFEGADLHALHALTTVRAKLNIGSTEVLTQEEWESPDLAAAQALRERWLESLHGLEALESVGTLSLNGYAGRDVDPLSSLQYITDGLLDIQNNRELEGLEGLRNAKGIRSLYVGGCPDLYGIEALSLPEQMTDLRLEFTGLSRLGELDVHTITGTLSIDHTELRNLDELSSLTYAGLIYIEANFSLQNADGLNGLGQAESIEFEHNVRLEHLPEFSSLRLLDYFRAI